MDTYRRRLQHHCNGQSRKTKESSDELRAGQGSKANGAPALRAVRHKLKVKLTDGLEKLRIQAGIMHRGLKEEDASAAAVMRPWAMEIMRCGPGVREGGRSSGVGIGIVVRIPGIVATQRAAVVTRWHCGQNGLEPRT